MAKFHINNLIADVEDDICPRSTRVRSVHAIGAGRVGRGPCERVACGVREPATLDGAVGQTRNSLEEEHENSAVQHSAKL